MLFIMILLLHLVLPFILETVSFSITFLLEDGIVGTAGIAGIIGTAPGLLGMILGQTDLDQEELTIFS